ncbi:hypothetical protein PIB30_090007 [Stylosanthes scabra]|uniref:Uncharacterized protein n=1 Tax=Stylosanthes scabra TaxID=79078 RepID=A0ABU6SVR0_9FABA|nr:hypothetical protein [Stylosanthes scabra]
MKKRSLRSKERSLEAILPRSPTYRRGSWRICMSHHEQTTPRHPLIKPRRDHHLCPSMHRHRSPCICMDHHSLSPTASTSTPRRAPGSLGVAFTFPTKHSRVHA